MYQAWFKVVVLQATLWSQPFAKEGDFQRPNGSWRAWPGVPAPATGWRRFTRAPPQRAVPRSSDRYPAPEAIHARPPVLHPPTPLDRAPQ